MSATKWGVTHKNEWDCFIRATQNKKLFPVELSSYLIKGKNCLFGAWLDGNRDWDKAKLIVERTHKNSSEALSGWHGVKGKALVAEYGEDKAKLLMEKRFDKGLYYNDEDFPDDKLERYYYMKKARELNRRQVVEDSTKMQTQANLDNDMVRSLTDEAEGMFKAGALPDMVAATSHGQRALCGELCESGAVAVKKKRKTGEEETKPEEAKPKTIMDIASDKMADVLAESTNARKKSMALGAAEYAGELASQLLEHANVMEKHYKTLQTALNGKVEDESFYKKCFKVIDKDKAWFTSAEAAADSILNGLKRANKKKDGKAKSKAAAKWL